MSFFTVSRIKSSHVARACYGCAQTIRVGEPKTTTATVADGEFFFSNFHPECYDALKAWQARNPHEVYWPPPGSQERPTIPASYYND